MNDYPYRCEDAEAYELQDGEFSSGIFMKYLKKHILQEKKVTHMLEDVLEGKGVLLTRVRNHSFQQQG